MKRRIVAVLLILTLFVGILPTASAAGNTLETSVDLDQLVAHGISMFKTLEAGGKYNSVVNTSVGCVGMGIMGWIGSSALQLLKWCASPAKGGDPEYCRSVLGDALYNEVVNAPVAIADTLMPAWSYWKTRTFTSAEIAAAKTLLGSQVGIRAQNALAKTYILAQAKRGWKAGVRTEAALLYYCSIDNHYGEGGAKTFMTYIRRTLGIQDGDLILSLNIFHNAVIKAAKSYSTVNSSLSYRKKVYNYLTGTLGLSADSEPGVVPFTDMPDPSHWAYDAIYWAYTNDPQITAGTSATTFSPNETVTRADALTFLWIAAGKPNPKSTTNPFTDVKSTNYFYKPVLWAVEKGITCGTTATTFSPNETVTRAQFLTFLWNYSGRPAPGGSSNPYKDVPSDKYFYNPILWGYHGGILVGNEAVNGNFQPNLGCSRAYVVTYLYDLFVLTAP